VLSERFSTFFSAVLTRKNRNVFLLDSAIKNESIIMGFCWLSDALLSYWTFRSSLMLFHRAPCWSYDKKCRQHISRNLPDDLFVWVFSSNWIIFRLLLSGEREKKHIAQPHLFTILGSIIIEHDNWSSSSFIWKHETKLHFSLKSQSDPIIHKESLFLSGFASLIELVNVPYVNNSSYWYILLFFWKDKK